MKNLSKLVSEHRWLFLLALLLLFFQPYRLGLKIDPATYGALAKQIQITGSYWPLGLYDGFFKEFYDHPPFVVWLMSLFMRLPLRDDWTVHLLSRLCCLLTLLLGALTLELSGKNNKKDAHKKQVAFLFITLSWMDWLKFAGAGQLEGPLSLWLMAVLYFCVKKIDLKPTGHPFIWLLLGWTGFMIKGVFTLPVLAGLLLYSVFRKMLFLSVFLAIAGWFLGVGFLFALDHLYQTSFISSYFGTQVFGTVFHGGIRGVEPLSFSFLRIFSALRTWLEIQIKYSALWSIPFLLLVPLFLIKKRRTALHAGLVIALVIYISFMGPISVSAFKLPHWLVPVYPVGAFVLSVLLPWEKVNWPTSMEPVFKVLILILVLIHSFVPLSTANRVSRGEEFTLNRQYIEDNHLKFERLDLFPEDEKGMPLLFQKAYASFYFLPEMKIHLSVFSDLLKVKCEKNLAVLSRETWDTHKAQLSQLGWEESPIRLGQSKFLFCSNFETKPQP